MIFHSVNKFAFVSECENYKVTISHADKQLLFSCYRVKQNNPDGWDCINEHDRSYLTYQQATLRIEFVHENEPEKAYKIPEHLRDRATQYTAQSSLNKIKGFLE